MIEWGLLVVTAVMVIATLISLRICWLAKQEEVRQAKGDTTIQRLRDADQRNALKVLAMQEIDEYLWGLGLGGEYDPGTGCAIKPEHLVQRERLQAEAKARIERKRAEDARWADYHNMLPNEHRDDIYWDPYSWSRLKGELMEGTTVPSMESLKAVIERQRLDEVAKAKEITAKEIKDMSPKQYAEMRQRLLSAAEHKRRKSAFYY